jgi:predicted anti-sigma-YlaC factor YlaD
VNQTNCEEAMMQIMAELEGEETAVSSEQAAAHLAFCGACRQEIEQLQNTLDLLTAHQRRAHDADLWPEIENRLEAQTGVQHRPASQAAWQPFLILGAFLVAYKLLELLPEREPGWFLKLVPVILIVALFGFLKENPFKINTELTLER